MEGVVESRRGAAVDTFTTRVANYVYDASSNELQRRTCAERASTGVDTLATRVASAPTVKLRRRPTLSRRLPEHGHDPVTETNDPSTGPTAYSFTLTASVRSDGQATPDSTNAAGSPLLVLGGSCSGGYGFHLGGSSDIVVNGTWSVNATDGRGCHAMDVNGSGHT